MIWLAPLLCSLGIGMVLLFSWLMAAAAIFFLLVTIGGFLLVRAPVFQEIRCQGIMSAQGPLIGSQEMWSWDLHTDMVTLSPALRAQWGLPAGENPVPWRDCEPSIHPDDLRKVILARQTVREGSDFFQVTYRLKNVAGRERIFLERGEVLPDASGIPLSVRGGTLEITEKNHSETQLREQALILEGLHEAVVVLDSRLKIVTWNQGAERTFGYMASEMVGKDWGVLFPPSRDFDTTGWFTVVDPALKNGWYLFEERQRRKDGAEFDASISVTVLRNEHGGVERLVAVISDISAQNKMLAEKEAQLRTLKLIFDELPIRITMKNREGQYLLGNRKILEEVGKTPEEFLDMSLLESELGTPEQLAQIAAFDQRAMESGQVVEIPEFTFTPPGRGESIFHIIKIPILGGPVESEGLVSMNIDITGRVKVEQELLKSQATLNLAQEISKIGVWDRDLEHGSIKWSEETYRIFGRQPENFEPNFEKFLKSVYPEDRAQVEFHLKEALGDREEYDVTHRIVRPDHSIRYVMSKARVFRDQNFRALRMLGVIEDITAQMTIVNDLQSYTRRLRQSNRELESFAAVASHDLQEPLRKVEAFGNRLKKQMVGAQDEKGDFYLERILSATGRMRGLINDLLAFSRLTTKAQPFSQVDLNEIVHQAVAGLGAQIRMGKTKMVIQPLPTITGDPDQIRQLFQNLLDNSLKFQKTGTGLRVKISQVPLDEKKFPHHHFMDKKFFQIDIQDNGIGFEDKYAERIFDIFKRLHNAQEYGGTGMGLALCRKIVDRHQGAILAQGRPGKGATFSIILPSQATTRTGGKEPWVI